MIELPLISENQTDYSEYNQKELDNIFVAYCALGEFNKLKDMMNSPNMEIFPNMHVQNDKAFKYLIENGNMEIIDYLIFEKNIDKSLAIDNSLEISESKHKDAIKNKFIMREVNKDLNVELVGNKSKVKKNKV